MAEIAVMLATVAGLKLLRRLADTLYDSISGELSLLIGVHEEVQHIIDELQIMSAFLREAEEKQANNEAVRAWVQQVRQVSYTVEDCIDEFSFQLEQHKSKNLKTRHHIAAKIKSIKTRVQEVSNRRLRYGIVDMNKASSSEDYNFAQYDPRLAALFIEDAQLVGVDVPRQKLVGWLIDEVERELSLIAVVGGGGLGKTTIVRKAYEDPTVMSGHFTCKAWITVSQTYRIEELLRDMIKQCNLSPPKDLDKLGMQQLIAELKGYLCNKRYIIVFDDIWKIDAWKSLEIALPNDNVGSRIMLTTRNIEIAEARCSQIRNHVYHHEKLSHDQSMELFCRRVFNDPDNAFQEEELKNVSEDLVKKCDGLPLAIVSIAGVLASKSKKTIKLEWEKLVHHLGSELEGNANLEGVKQILTLSYNDLPYHVKRCFLYLSKFPEDYVIDRKDIQSLWIVEGFVAGRRDMTAEEVAESCFNEIVNRFMILPSTFSVNGRVKSFRVHDIMLELLVSKSLEENFVTVVGKSGGCVQQDDVNRRLSIHSRYNPRNVTQSHMRSLSMFGDGIMPISPLMRMLRVLDMGCRKDYADNHSIENVGALLHLKYLRMRIESRLKTSWGNLQNLVTLDLRGSTSNLKIPSGVIKCQQLRVLRAGVMRVPRGIGRLRNLQELARVDVGSSSRDVAKEIGKLTQLRKLSICAVPVKSFNDFHESLQRLSGSLRSLNISSWDQVLPSMNNLSSPPLLLETLGLQLHGGDHGKYELPNWVGSLNKVVRIKLQGCYVDDSAIKVLGSLPNLMKLSLAENHHHEGRLFFDAGGFPGLKVLRIKLLKNATSLNFEQGAMLHLEVIAIHYYPASNQQPQQLVGIKNLPSLKEINILGMGRDLWAAVRVEIDEHPNHPRAMERSLW